MDEVLKIIERLINERHVNGAEAIKLINAVNGNVTGTSKNITWNIPEAIKTNPLPLGTIIKYDFEKSPTNVEKLPTNGKTINSEDKCKWVTTASDNGHKIGYYCK